MVTVNYNDTIYSFKHGAKFSKWLYTAELSLMSLGAIICLIPLIILSVTGTENSEIIFALCGLTVVFFLFDMFFLGVLLHEVCIVKKSIIECITAPDAKLMTVVPFEYSTQSSVMLSSTYKVGVKFRYGDSKVTMLSKKFGIKKDYIGVPVQIIYSPSCDDVVVLKK